MDKEKLIKILDKRFSAVNGGLQFVIIRDGVLQESDWWYVPVIATRAGKDVPREIVINIFATIETEMEDEHQVTVMFIPAVA